ncbi:MAG: ABC transporter permease [Acidobacteria bacterium]|nr:MAG: ABC transporter permease [Acidobacteriota bacterium]
MGNKEAKIMESRIPPFKRLFELALPEWRWLLAGTLFLVIGSLTTLVYPQAIRLVIDQALENQDIQKINQTAFWLLLIFAVQGVAVSLRYFIYTYTGEKIVNNLRSRLYQAIVNREIAFFDTNLTGELLSRITTDTTVIQNTVTVNISMVLRNIIMAVGGTVLLLIHSVQLSLLILVLVPPVALGTVYFGKRIRRTARKSQDALAKANQIAEETISSIRTVRSFSAEPHEEKRYSKALRKALLEARKRMGHIAVFQGITTFAGFAIIALILWYGGRLVFTGQMTIGALTSFILYTVIVAFSLATLGSLWTDFMRAGGAAERVFEILDSSQTDDSGKLKQKTCKGNIQFKHVGFTYPSRDDLHVLNDVSFEIHTGESIALVGPSGSGKSTVSRLLLGFYKPDQGEILLDNTELSSYNMSWLRKKHIGLVDQEPVLFSTTIMNNIRYGNPKASESEVLRAAREANAMEFIDQFPEGFETVVGERGIKLSGGQKQRIAIARAILKDPAILILDEATSALDSHSESLVKEALTKLMQSRTTLIIAHRLSTVKDASRVFVLDRGRTLQSGTHRELMQDKSGTYYSLVQNQIIDLVTDETASSGPSDV